jgi:AbiV family abortive infection protein
MKSADAIAEGVWKAYETAISHADAAKVMFDSGNHALAASLAVLSAEEIGKMVNIDGLLFAHRETSRKKDHDDAFMKHSTKLSSSLTFPWFFFYLSRFDPGQSRGSDFETIQTILHHHVDEWANLGKVFGSDFDIRDLNRLKQSGLYSQQTENESYQAPAELVTKEQATAVLNYVRNMAEGLKLIFPGIFEKYREGLRDLQANLTGEEWTGVNQTALNFVGNMVEKVKAK